MPGDKCAVASSFHNERAAAANTIARARSIEQIETILLWEPQDDGVTSAIRVWNSKWDGGMFTVVTHDQFKELEQFCIRFSIPLKRAL